MSRDFPDTVCSKAIGSIQRLQTDCWLKIHPSSTICPCIARRIGKVACRRLRSLRGGNMVVVKETILNHVGSSIHSYESRDVHEDGFALISETRM